MLFSEPYIRRVGKRTKRFQCHRRGQPATPEIGKPCKQGHRVKVAGVVGSENQGRLSRGQVLKPRD